MKENNKTAVSFKRVCQEATLFIIIAAMIISLLPLMSIEIYALTSADLTISDNGIAFICAREGFHAACYPDNSQSSIGYGTKCTGSSTQPHAAGLHTITKDEALATMKSQVNNTYVPRVRKQTTGITMNQNQFDALVSLCFNCGGGTSLISNSPLVKYLKGELSEYEARSQYSSYIVKSGGKVLQGLINRRNQEADLFFSGLDPVNVSDNPDDYPYPSRNLYYTSPVMTGNDVKWVQAVLRNLGYSVAIDGSYGPGTRDAVAQFQSDYSLSVDGKAGTGETQPKLKTAWENLKNGKTRVNKVSIWASTFGQGYSSEEATKISSGITQTHYYLWYKIYDENTGDLYEQYGNLNYTVTLYWLDSSGNTVYSSSYNNSCCNWIGVTPVKAEKYTLKAVLSGGFNAELSFDFDVAYDCNLQASSNNISLNLNGTKQLTNTITVSGGYPGKYGLRYSIDNNSIATANWGEWDGNSCPITITGLKYGNTNISISVYENYTENQTVLKTITLPISVDANTYTVSYNANGGTGAPSCQTKYHGTDIALSSVIPTKSYTITYNANGGTVSTASKVVNCTFNNWKCSYNGSTYNPSGIYAINANTTMTAQWTNPTAGTLATPTRSGYIFDGWYTDAGGGSQITASSTISGNTTLYAHWALNDTTKPTGSISSTNNVSSSQTVTLTMGDSVGLSGYYWGTSSSTSPSFTSVSGTSKTVTVTVSASGTYYLTVKDISGNVYQVSKTFYKTMLDANGGSVSPTSVITASGNSFTLPIPTKTNYSYVGWSTSSSATSGVKTLVPTSNATYYAVWDYVDTVKPIGSISSTNNVASSQTVTLTISDNIGLAGYYWGTNRDNPTFTSISGTNKTVNVTVSSSGTYFLIIKDTAGNTNQNSMTFYQTILNANNGAVAPSSIITASGNSFTLPTPTRSGYTYDGWATSKTDTIGVNALTPTANGIYYAVWRQNILLGDVNDDGEIDAADAGLISRYDAGFITLTAEQLQAGDVNKDGEVDAADAGLISRYDAGFIASFA